MITEPDFVLEVFLQPGEFFFGDSDTRIRTLLGSCVSITAWHPQRRIGGMCHYMLPARGNRQASAPDWKYADEAVEMFLREIAKQGTQPHEYEVKLFGGGNMFSRYHKQRKTGHAATRGMARQGIAGRNVEAARTLLQPHGFQIKAESLGGNNRRHIIFDVWSGHVWVRHGGEEDLVEEPTKLKFAHEK